MFKRLAILGWLYCAFATVSLLASTAQNKPPDSPEKGIAKSDSSSQRHPQLEENRDDHDAQKTPPVVVKVEAPYADHQQDMGTEKQLASYTFWLMVLTGVLGIIGIGQGYFLRRQASHLKEHAGHLSDLTKAATDNAIAAKSAAEMAEAAVDATRAATAVLISTQRAFISFLGEGRIVTRTDESGGILGYELQLSYENSGGTPAREVLMQFNVHWRDDDLPADYPYPDFGSPGNPMMVGPKVRQFGLGVLVPREEVNALREGKRRIYFYGWAEYRDIFSPETPVRRTEYCFQLKNLEIVGEQQIMISFSAHSDHNNAT